MKRILLTVGAFALAVGMIGCPANSSQRQQVAQAAQTASTVVVAFQQGEIVAHNQGLISNDDHVFIQKELVAVSAAGRILDTCILQTTTPQGDLACISTATAQIDQINTDGGLYLKSANAKQQFQAAMAALKISLTAISQVLGGK